jgi:hypothetical protein
MRNIFITISLFLLVAFPVFAEDVYVDSTIADCTTYRVTERDCGSGSERAYSAIQEAVDYVSTSDDIYIRGGTYNENVTMDSNQGASGIAEDYATIQSYLGEWAIINASGGTALGRTYNGRDGGNEFEYLTIQRLEITGGGSTNSGGGIGIAGDFLEFRYLYIHDNTASNGNENPAGIRTYALHDSIIEYCYFDNNGMDSGTDNNSAHIAMFGDYAWNSIGENGFNGTETNVTTRNTIRYNYFNDAPIAIKHKGGQLFTGRNTGGADFVDTYKTMGDKIHHNLFQNIAVYCINAEQDFCQIYQNIFDNPNFAIVVHYQPDFQLYKVTIYNNTIWNPVDAGITRFGCIYSGFSGFTENQIHYGYDWNNIFDSADVHYTNVDSMDWGTTTAINILWYSGGSRTQYSSPDLITGYYSSDNYFYRPDDPDQFRMIQNNFFTVSEFEGQSLTHTPRDQYTNAYSGGDLLYVGTTGADKFVTRGAHVVDGATTIANGGIGGAHPYLNGVTIPSFVGATNPSDNDWVDGLLSDLTSTAWLEDQTGDPTWIEGAEAASTPSMSGVSFSGGGNGGG